MEYKVLSIDSDSQTALVEMTIGENVLNQNIAIGSSPDQLLDLILGAMAQFQYELSLIPQIEKVDTSRYDDLIDTVSSVTDLPVIPVIEPAID